MPDVLIVMGTTVVGGALGGFAGYCAAFFYASWEPDSIPGALGLMAGGLIVGGVAGAGIGAMLV